MKKALIFFLLAGCAYRSPPSASWPRILAGASNEPISATLRAAKRPLYQDAGGELVASASVRGYMDRLELRLENTLRKPGIQIARIGTDIIITFVRASIIYTDTPEISKMGDDLLGDLARILNEFDRTWIEITGYSDAMGDQTAARKMSLDMARRVAVYLARHAVRPIRLFIAGRGSSNPISDNDSDLGRLMNRRVEIRLSAVN
ncbi:MAG: OmpA family protein [Rickettsiales bacterium]|jgi:outer membrane protein OmpA-like peptidoglycan-associated protein|nr:OmpA family protein [Rickettsiales bacterium]